MATVLEDMRRMRRYRAVMALVNVETTIARPIRARCAGNFCK
tara:strand:+ start:836 stop:961 length:126 start_codon:yes stop_codon:yes gene_type:complete